MADGDVNGDKEYIRGILQKHARKNFVRRILTPENFPVLQNQDKSVSTHSMAWGEADGKFFVYPTVVDTGKGLTRLEGADAWSHSQSTGDYIQFDSAKEAAWFSRNYKKIWNQ